MKKIYEAYGKDKEDIIDCDNDYIAFHKERINDITINDLVMISRVDMLPKDKVIKNKWCLNGILTDKEKDIIIFEPFAQHINDGIRNISSNNIEFKDGIKLSQKAIILMPTNRYDELCKDEKTKKQLKKMNVRLYEGKEKLAVKMLMRDKYYIHLEIDENGYVIDEKNHLDAINFTEELNEKLNELNKFIQENNLRNNELNKEKEEKQETKIQIINDSSNYKMITGLTQETEGDITLDNKMFAATDIGKVRENQEDAVLLIHDKENPNFKMMVVADGMGGHERGEIASNTIINRLKYWFENLNDEQKQCYNTSVKEIRENLVKVIEEDVQPAVRNDTKMMGGSTLVCAIIGKNDTLIANVGDSRAYIAKKGKLIQLSREDTEAQTQLKKGKVPTKEAARFHEESNILLQAIGMNPRDLITPYAQIINNNEYDLLMLFTDGVTDCLSDDDIVVVCKTSDKKELASKIVEKALRHDSVVPEEYEDYTNLNYYISGGKDNATAAVYMPEIDEEER